MKHIGWSMDEIDLHVDMGKFYAVISCILSSLLLFNGCNAREEGKLQFPALSELTADSLIVPPVLLSVTRLFIAKDMLVTYEQKKDTMFSFWSLPKCNYLFSAGCRGEGPDEFLMLDRTFIATSNGFKTFEIASNRVKEITVDSTGYFKVDVIKQLEVDQRGLNRFLFLLNNTYCFVSDNEDFEYGLFDQSGNIQHFSDYPIDLLQKNKDEINRFVYNKLTIANPVGDRFAAFYAYAKLCRIYNNNGKLLNETLLESSPNSVSENRYAFYQYYPCMDADYIYILTTENKRKVLEVWNWDGVPIAHYLLDKDIVNITVSSNKIYAVDNKNERVIYTYSLADIINKDES